MYKKKLNIMDIMRTFKWVNLLAIVFLSACDNSRTVATLPDHEVRGYESSAFILYESTKTEGTTAMGQVFSPPDGHGYLTDVGFAFRHQPYKSEEKHDTFVKLRISSWEANHPASTTQWESETKVVAGKMSIEWIRFKVAHLQLTPGRKYIAWLSSAGLNNPKGTSTTVISMGPTTSGPPPLSEKHFQPIWKFDYQDGFRAFWRNPNPDSTVAGMTESDWQVDALGKNLRFEMKFENGQ